MGEFIRGYALLSEFSNKDAGMCQWTFARKDGKYYFIKQLLECKYPTAEAEKKLSAELVKRMRAEADKFFAQRSRFYSKLAECNTGNIVAAREFFREGGSLYLVTDRVHGPFLKIEQIAKLSDEKKMTLTKAVLYSIMHVHERKIVHSDLKPENVLVKQTAAGFCTAKIIDFEAGFFEDEVPDEIVGDQRYFSPEAVLRNAERDVPVGVKSDIFALGLLFHQYWSGDFPKYNRSEYDSASIALLEHEKLALSKSLPPDIHALISMMLQKHQEDRPSAQEAWELLSNGASSTRKSPADGWHIPGLGDL